MNNKYEWLNKRYLRSVDQLRLWDENPRLNPDEKHLTIVDFVEDLIGMKQIKVVFLIYCNLFPKDLCQLILLLFGAKKIMVNTMWQKGIDAL